MPTAHMLPRKRTREVYDTGMIPHLWANQSQESARNPQGNLYFNGSTIYSYGSHFPIARHAENRYGKPCILLTTRTYGPTTGGHISATRSAIKEGTLVFHVKELGTGSWGPMTLDLSRHAENFADYLKRIDAKALEVKRAKANRDWKLSSLRGLITEANTYSQFFGLRKRVKGGDDLEKLTEEIAAQTAALTKAEAKRKREAEKKAQAALVERIARWVAGEDSPTPYDAVPIRLRAVYCPEDHATNRPCDGEPNTLQTSAGASIPLDHAKRAFTILAKLHEQGETYHANGHTIHLGHFSLDSMDEGGTIRAGCHVVEWSEVERIARQLGLI